MLTPPVSLDTIAVLKNVREYVGGEPVELARNQQNGRIVIRAYNEGGNNCTEIDLFDLLAYLQSGPEAQVKGLDGRDLK